MTKMNAQLAVIGGGPAGICAALAAARRGMDTILLTNRPVLGGNSSSEIRVWTRGSVGAGNLYAEEMGIWGELKMENLYCNPDANPVFWDEVLLDAVLGQNNLRLLLNTEISDLEMAENRIVCVTGHQLGTEQTISVEADVFIDATGDGTLGEKAGVPYYIGTSRIDPELGQMPQKREVLCSTIMFYTRKEDHPVTFVAPRYAHSQEYIAGLVGSGGRILSEKMGGSDCWWFEYGGSLDTIADSQNIGIELKRLVMGIWNYIKNSGQYDADNYTLEWIGSVPGKRESRRMETAYMLTEKDVENAVCFEDGGFYGGWYVDMHPSGGMRDVEKENCVQTPVHVYQIPLRCLYNMHVPNLLFAGRNIGTERDAFASSRVMNTCALSGQAAAELGAMMIESGCSPDRLTAEQIQEIRLRLVREDMFLPGTVICDSRDLIQTAQISASSWNCGACGQESGRFSLSEGGFVTLPGAKNVTVKLTVIASDSAELRGAWTAAKLPNRFCGEAVLSRESWKLLPGRQELELSVPAENQFCTLTFEPSDGVELVLCKRERTGFVCGRRDLPQYQEPMLAYSEDIGLYTPENVKNAVGRPWGKPNEWLASQSDLQPYLEIRWQQPQTIETLILLLDPSLNEELPSSRAKYWQESHHYAPRSGMPPHLIRELSVEVLTDAGEWVSAAHLADNHQRRIKLHFDDMTTTALRLVCRRTWGGTPGIYGLRCYAPDNL